MAKYLVLIYGDEQRWANRTSPGAAGARGRPRGVPARRPATRVLGGHELSRQCDGHQPPGRRRRADDHRRAVPGDQGGPRRLLPRRGRRPRRGDPLVEPAARGGRRPQRRRDPPDRGALLTGPTADVASAVADAHRRGVGVRPRQHGAADARPRPGRGVHAGRVRAGPRALAARRGPAPPGAWLTTVAGEPRPRRAPARGGAATTLPLLVADETRPADRPAAGRRRPAPAGVHLLPPGAVGGRPGRAHPAAGLRPVDRRRWPAPSWSRSRPWPRGSPGPRRRSPRRGSPTASRRRTELPGAARRRPRRGPPRLHDGPRGARPATPWSADDLVDRALDLGRLLHRLLPDDAGVAGLLALMLLIDARRDTRVARRRAGCCCSPSRTAPGGTAPRSSEGVALLPAACARRAADRYAVEAAVAAVHAEAPTWEDTDWDEIVALYDVLLRLWPSPVVALNRAAAVGLRDGPRPGSTRWRRCATSRSRHLPLPQRRPGRLPAPPGPARGGASGVRGGAGADRQRRRARLPRRAAGAAQMRPILLAS